MMVWWLACGTPDPWPVVPGGTVVADHPQSLVVTYPAPTSPGAAATALAHRWSAALEVDGWQVGPLEPIAEGWTAELGEGPDGRARRLTVCPLAGKIVVSVVVVHGPS